MSHKDVFLSHSSKDKEYVRDLANELDRCGISYWLDEAEIKWGENITKKINDGLSRSSYVIVFLSNNFMSSNWPEAELNAALNKENSSGEVVVLPLIISNSDNDIKNILNKYPLLRDKSYREWGEDISVLAEHLYKLLNTQSFSSIFRKNHGIDIQNLQKNAIELLSEVSSLMQQAISEFGSNLLSQKYGNFQQEIDNETEKVKNLELRMAIAAPMKAGKSTIINAVSGYSLLPTHEAAMTTIPTEIIFNAKLSEPILLLSQGNYKIFQQTVQEIKDEIQKRGIEKILEDIKRFPQKTELEKLIKKIQENFSIFLETRGGEKIVDTLTDLNHIIRLCRCLELPDPLRHLSDIPRIQTSFWQSQDKCQQEIPGSLVIVDTPGPNEAGENNRLWKVVTTQLRASSLVLIVLNFTSTLSD